MTQQTQTPFLNTSSSLCLGMGSPVIQVYDVTALSAAGPTNITLTPATFPPANQAATTKGRLRVKSSAVNAATTIAIGNLTVTDGTNTVLVRANLLPTTAAGQNFDILFEFATDLNAISVTFPVTLAGTTMAATINSEFFANP